jgi:hypothetical protein
MAGNKEGETNLPSYPTILPSPKCDKTCVFFIAQVKIEAVLHMDIWLYGPTYEENH